MRPTARLPSWLAWWWLLPLLLGAALLWSLLAGSVALTPATVLDALLGREVPELAATVVRQVRLPRALLAALVGASLAASGGAFQGVLRNPLADPYLLGVSGGAALAAVLVQALGVSSPVALPLAAFVGALTALLLVAGLAGAGRASRHTLILTGGMVGSLCAALLLFLLWTIPADPLRAAVFWLSGTLAELPPGWMVPPALLALCAFALLWWRADWLDLLAQGEEAAADLGLAVGRARWLLLGGAGALAGAAVALAGLVGFVGLVVPHAVRLLWGPAHRRLLPAAALLGAAFLVAADALARTLLAPAEIPVGVVTALLGAPLFLLLLRREGRGR